MNDERKLPFPVWANFEFNGSGSEYFRIWIVNILLTIITLGFYSPWAKVRREHYFHGNTVVNGSSFQYTADPKRILRGRLIALGVFVIFSLATEFYPTFGLFALALIGLLFPFALVASMAFRLRNTLYRNMRFRFDADVLGAYGMFILPFACIILIATGLYAGFATTDAAMVMDATAEETEFRLQDMISVMYLVAVIPFIPLFAFIIQKFIIDRSNYGSAKGHLSASMGSFYLVFLKTACLLVLAMAITGGAIYLAMNIFGAADGIARVAQGAEDDTVEPGWMALGFGIAMIGMLVFYAIGFFVAGYLNAAITNLTYNNTEFGPLQLDSALKGRELGWIFLSNTIAIILSLGMLIPWSKVRVARYKASKTQLLARDVSAIEAIQQADQSAFGEELGEVFGFDFGV
jgi:uncharacterized membrane protein YjgN (DUF898 family)